MNHTRRDFLRTGAALALTAGVSKNVFAGQPNAGLSTSPTLGVDGALPVLSKAQFESRLGAVFQIKRRSTRGLRLVEVKDLPVKIYGRKESAEANYGECFKLTFYEFTNSPMTQQTCAFRDSVLGTFELFIVPALNQAGEQYYTAIINRVKM